MMRREEKDTLISETGHEADFNILLATLQTILKWEHQLRDALLMKDACGACDMLDYIIVLASPLIVKEDRITLDNKTREIKALVYPNMSNPNSEESRRNLMKSHNEGLIAIRDLWLETRLAMQRKGLLMMKSKNPSQAIKGG